MRVRIRRRVKSGHLYVWKSSSGNSKVQSRLRITFLNQRTPRSMCWVPTQSLEQKLISVMVLFMGESVMHPI